MVPSVFDVLPLPPVYFLQWVFGVRLIIVSFYDPAVSVVKIRILFLTLLCLGEVVSC